jgi:hypothetical protein
VLEKFNQTFGTNTKTISDLGKESVKFTNELQKLGTGISLFVAGPLTSFLSQINDAFGFVSMKTVERRVMTEAYNQALQAFFPGTDMTATNTTGTEIDIKTWGMKVDGMSFHEYKRSLWEGLFPKIANEAGLGGQESDFFGLIAPDFQQDNLQRLIKERREFELSSLNKQLDIEQKSLGFRSEDLDVLKKRMDLLKIVEKIKVKDLVNTDIMTEAQKEQHEFELDKLEIERQISEELLRQAIIMSDPMKAAIVDLNKEMAKFNDLRFQTVEFAEAVGSSFQQSFKGIIKGTMSVTDAFRNMFNRIADHFLDMAAQMIANSLQRGLIGMLGNMFGNPINEVLPQTIHYAANGGPVGYKNPYIVGEQGPELFVPNQSGNIIPNHDLAGVGGGSMNIVVNVDASGTSVEGNEANGEELGRLIGAVVQSELIKEKRPGGLLS